MIQSDRQAVFDLAAGREFKNRFFIFSLKKMREREEISSLQQKWFLKKKKEHISSGFSGVVVCCRRRLELGVRDL